MKPGEYMGADGNTYRIFGVDVGPMGVLTPDHPDFPAAMEALAALVPKPFEWEGTGGGTTFRYANGRVECRGAVTGEWTLLVGDVHYAFNAGRRYERERGDENT
jgi:hypothetical protein